MFHYQMELYYYQDELLEALRLYHREAINPNDKYLSHYQTLSVVSLSLKIVAKLPLSLHFPVTIG